MKFIISAMLSSIIFSTQAATIAVVDSGVDVEHKDLLTKLWTNSVDIPNNNRDEDGNGYQDDFYGWNFAENNNLVIDRKYIGTFSKEPHKYFEIQGKMLVEASYEEDQGLVTPEESHWLRQRTDSKYDKFDEELSKRFRKEMGIFGNFVHGTHVAGITQEDNPLAKILSIKLIPTEVGLIAQKYAKLANFNRKKGSGVQMKLLKGALDKLAAVQMDMLEEIGYYLGQHKADVMNGSFGTGFEQAKGITAILFKVFFFREPTEQESNEVTGHFMNALIKEGKRMIDAAPNTLFVFAAGNSKSDNDKFPSSPTNVRGDNIISVAATYKYDVLAPFSNYGKKLVDVAAPGMLIRSQIPGNEYLEVSGTSQASPFVANVAAQIKDTNRSLTPKEIKDILVGTVDKKLFLKEKVKSGGVINSKRALFAAKSSRTMTLVKAIKEANSKVSEVKSKKMANPSADLSGITPLPLLKMFK